MNQAELEEAFENIVLDTDMFRGKKLGEVLNIEDEHQLCLVAKRYGESQSNGVGDSKPAGLNKLVVTEHVGSSWTLNIGKFNDETDVVIPEFLAKCILKFKEIEEAGSSGSKDLEGWVRGRREALEEFIK